MKLEERPRIYHRYLPCLVGNKFPTFVHVRTYRLGGCQMSFCATFLAPDRLDLEQFRNCLETLLPRTSKFDCCRSPLQSVA